MITFLFYLVIASAYGNALLHQVNEVNVFCRNEAEFLCSQLNEHEVQWVVTLSNGISRSLSFNSLTDSVAVEKFTVIQSTIMKATLVFVNSSYILTSLTLAAHLNATIRCHSEYLLYEFEDCKLIFYDISIMDKLYLGMLLLVESNPQLSVTY